MRHPFLVEGRPNGARQSLASTLLEPRVAATSYCDPGRHTPPVCLPPVNVPNLSGPKKRCDCDFEIGHRSPRPTSGGIGTLFLACEVMSYPLAGLQACKALRMHAIICKSTRRSGLRFCRSRGKKCAPRQGKREQTHTFGSNIVCPSSVNCLLRAGHSQEKVC